MNLQVTRTNPKLPIRESRNMKFNWRANWEILLVLVIIVVGIVITTIAAIRNKDKHLLLLPEETEYGQLFINGAGSSEQTAQMPPMPQSDFQLQNAQLLNHLDEANLEQKSSIGRATAHQPLQLLDREQANHNNSDIFNNTHHDQLNHNPHRDHGSRQQHSLNSVNDVSYHPGVRQQLSATKSDDRTEFSKSKNPSRVVSNSKLSLPVFGSPSIMQTDNYDATSTESTPSRYNQLDGLGQFSEENAKQSKKLPTRSSSNNRRNALKPQHKYEENQLVSTYNSESIESPYDKTDDIHTTRSSLAAKSSRLNENSITHTNDNNRPSTISDPSISHETTVSIPPSMSMRGPYAVTPSPIGQNSNQFNQFIAQHSNLNKIEPAPPSPIYSDDMMTSYTRVPSRTGNLSDYSLRPYNSAGGTDETNSTQSNNIFGHDNNLPENNVNAGLNHDLTSLTKSRSPMATLPFSVLLSDLIKLTRPTPLMDPQAGFEQPANSKPQYGILQQLRSLPGPLLALLQGSSGGPNSLAELGSSNHDASESNQHYQRISFAPTDIHSILARSLQSPSLPAFPAPKGTPQRWIPPTSGGSPIENEAMNSNADFVASNTAGFLRSNGQQPQQPEASHQSTGQALGQQANTQFVPNYPQNPATRQDGQSNVVDEAQQQQHHHPQQQQLYHQANRLAKLDYQPDLERFNQQSNFVVGSAQQPGNPVMPLRYQGSYPFDSINAQLNDPQFNAISGPSSLNFRNNAPMQQNMNQIQYYNPSKQMNELSLASGNTNQMNQVNLRHILSTNQQLQESDLAMPGLESSPKASSVLQQHNQQPSNDAKHNQQMIQSSPTKTMMRHRRAVTYGDMDLMATRNVPFDDEEEFLDSRLISVVRPDGRSMEDHVRIGRPKHNFEAIDPPKNRNNRISALSGKDLGHYRNEQHIDSKALHHYASVEQRINNGRPEELHTKKMKKNNNEPLEFESVQSQPPSKSNSTVIKNRPKSRKGFKHLDTASSGLMSKLLGTASTNDELEEDIDSDDDDSANERRKEELDDAEFGIVNDERSNNDQTDPQNVNSNDDISSNPPTHELSRVHEGEASPPRDSSLGSGSTGSEAYTRRNQQQSDIEFYGHPGEETRTLKYGILGSGNYEVVSGGVYPEADESTAAVNSVANYVRKPGLLLSGLPKLIAAGGHGHVSQLGAYMPGGRVGAFLQGASVNQGDLIGLLPTGGEITSEKGLSSPLLDLIDANGGAGHLFDSSLDSNLGSSGTSARTVHSNQDESPGHGLDSADAARQQKQKERNNARYADALDSYREEGDTGQNDITRSRNVKSPYKTRKKGDVIKMKKSSSKWESNKMSEEGGLRDSEDDDEQSDSHHKKQMSIAKNPFNSYQILPSKKVTIFSDQDLDSAPSLVEFRRLVETK